jgi:hypothetical protein
MHQRSKELRQGVSERANTSKLLPDNWQRFFDLTVHVNWHDVLMTGEQVRRHLGEHGFSAEASSRLRYMFELFCQPLRRYDEQTIFGNEPTESRRVKYGLHAFLTSP